MIFRVEICLLNAEPDRLRGAGGNEEVPWHDIYRVTLSVSAPDLSTAVSFATAAISESEDENGEYLGGVVIEARAVLVAASAFEGYEKYFDQPMEMPGLFYVSGRTHSTTTEETATPALEELARVKERRESRGTESSPRFVFRKHPEELTPKHFRMVCPVCEYWEEFDHLGVMYTFYDGLTDQNEEYNLAQATAKRLRQFVEHHLQCVARFGDDGSGLLCLYDDDEGYHKLESYHEEKR